MNIEQGKGWEQLCIFVCVTVAGALLHGLFDLWPSILTEFVAPVNESIWEHMKVVFWPLLVGFGVLYGRKGLVNWLSAVLLSSGLLLLLGWLSHVVLGAEAGFIDIAMYVLIMAAGSLLAAILRLPESWTGLVIGAAILLAGLMVTFTILPPDLHLFHDASLVDAWVVYPY